MTDATLRRYLDAADEWPGWFHRTDRDLFRLADAVQREQGLAGDLLEIGVYLGKSAALLGHLRRDAERLVVCDVFEPVGHPDDVTERPYTGLSRVEFERRYRTVHETLPDIVEDLSSRLLDHGLRRTFRFAHVDGGHTYDDVRTDARTVRELLVPGGIVVFDDWRAGHVPGVHAGVWGAVHENGLIPLVLSDAKFYGTYWPIAPPAAAFRDAVSDAPGIMTEQHDIRGYLTVLLV